MHLENGPKQPRASATPVAARAQFKTYRSSPGGSRFLREVKLGPILCKSPSKERSLFVSHWASRNGVHPHQRGPREHRRVQSGTIVPGFFKEPLGRQPWRPVPYPPQTSVNTRARASGLPECLAHLRDGSRMAAGCSPSAFAARRGGRWLFGPRRA